MNLVFADTWFYLAILNRADPNHPRATAASRSEHRHRVTTDFVLVEVGDALSKTGNRDVFTRFHDWIRRAFRALTDTFSTDTIRSGFVHGF